MVHIYLMVNYLNNIKVSEEDKIIIKIILTYSQFNQIITEDTKVLKIIFNCKSFYKLYVPTNIIKNAVSKTKLMCIVNSCITKFFYKILTYHVTNWKYVTVENNIKNIKEKKDFHLKSVDQQYQGEKKR